MTDCFYKPLLEEFEGVRYKIRISEDGTGKCAYATELDQSTHFAFVNGCKTDELAYRAIREAAESEIRSRW